MADGAALAVSVIEAFNANDWDKMQSLVAANHVYHELGTQRTMNGWDELLAGMKAWKEAMPDVKGTVTSATAAGNTEVLEISWEGTHTGPLQTPAGTIPASGKRQKTPAAWVAEVDGGKVKETRHYFDVVTLLQQIGAM